MFLFPVKYPEDCEITQNIILVAVKNKKEWLFEAKDEILNGYLNHRYPKEMPADATIFTDDFCPVESFL